MLFSVSVKKENHLSTDCPLIFPLQKSQTGVHLICFQMLLLFLQQYVLQATLSIAEQHGYVLRITRSALGCLAAERQAQILWMLWGCWVGLPWICLFLAV